MAEHADLGGRISSVLARRTNLFPQVPRQHVKYPAENWWSDSVLALIGIALAAWFALVTLGTFLFA